jgi:hypothetical protein
LDRRTQLSGKEHVLTLLQLWNGFRVFAKTFKLSRAPLPAMQPKIGEIVAGAETPAGRAEIEIGGDLDETLGPGEALELDVGVAPHGAAAAIGADDVALFSSWRLRQSGQRERPSSIFLSGHHLGYPPRAWHA